jgi:acyl dehydratase
MDTPPPSTTDSPPPSGLDLRQLGATSESEYRYDWRDVARYALSVGAGEDELPLVWEKYGPQVLPTFAVMPAFPVIDTLHRQISANLLGTVHLAQSIQLRKPLQLGGILHTLGTIDGIYDHGLIASCKIGTETRDETGELVFRTIWSIGFRFDGGFGGPPPPPRERVKPPRRPPDFTHTQPIPALQAFRYRLLGDPNPMHVDADVARRAGYARPILHGLCTYAFICRAVLLASGRGDAGAITEFAGTFRKPVHAGDRLLTQGWHEADRIVVYATTHERPDEPVFQDAYLRLRASAI